ncbi:MAG: ligase-associated DNA damage response DEXH box helicase [Phenylobacterium sp.]|uniref:ligase-associated DNA damage response DEXH box helicase n=2 Tax=Phenylobacterium sp. TaxID=1871053 RepID=UPI002716C8BE|nr:ligase-associated DNA damage response DEXH box helicase [Phenylobacterium sp.]MDO8911485.1 ligase-associated DNA damage response DEXH box helicase [Phenylobacterium sp.]MDP3098945.1 ligase-associated DNA damage response DEXH box helicase [Phenylobacterium sp.]MDP3632747.1 ligase-associated DNA damage response DEXH box helicase [Phenylobacterium sp.]MDP3868791.1 ligase-associated DNA damage response DEXH box helicase [Phenylobacterium sp.]
MAEDAGAAPPLLPPRFAAWFADRGWSAREHQLEMVAKGRAGRDALLIAPTGGGKTLAGFLPSLIELAERPPANTPRGIHTLYISPLKALAVDVERNLMAPILQMGLPIVAESRTGDTGQARRQRQRIKPPDILLTTPEQLALFCAWEGARLYFEDLACVIVDEIHAIHASKRGDLLALDLARLQTFAPRMRRVGLSATVDDPDVIRRWLGCAPPEAANQVDLVRGPGGAAPIVDMLLAQGRVPWAGHTAQHAMPEVYEAIKQARTALVFVNTRFQAEFAFQELWKLNDDDLPIALHHGSLAAEQRRKVEAAMARGELRAVVCTSTLDLGIDWGDVDLVIQLASPKGASRMVQRIGRANHRLDEPSRALFVPANRFEMLECQAAREAIAENRFDGDPARTGALDVLAQHVMGCACSEPFDLLQLYDELVTAGPYRDLAWEDFEAVVDFVSTGGYALKTYDRFRRIVKGQDGRWRVRDQATAQRHRMNVGAILSPAVLAVRIAMGKRLTGGRKIGEVEEGYVEMLEPGDTFIFAGQVWSLAAVTGLDVLVRPAMGKDPKMPSWGGSKFALSTFLAKRVRELMFDETHWKVLPNDVREWLEIQKDRSLIVKEEELLLETFPRGKRNFIVCYPFEGRLAHTTLAMLLTRRLERMGAAPLGFVCNDYAVAVWALNPLDRLDFDELFAQDMLGDDLESWLSESFMMKRAFKGCAIISGLIERRFPGEQQKSGRQVTFSTDLIYDVLRRHQPDHLLLRCAREDAATGLIDVARLGQLLARIQGKIRHAALDHLSPFSVPILLEIGKERTPGAAGEMILAEAESDLIAEAIA